MPSLKLPGYIAMTALLSVIGCGHPTKTETPEPVNQAPTSAGSTYTASDVSVEPIAENVLSREQRAILEERISFDFDQSDLSQAAREKLQAKAEILQALPTLSLRIEGHADERGSDEYNLALSSRRAATAMRFLMNQGMSRNRLETVGYGEERPLDTSETEAGWAQNRRDEFRVSSGPLAQQ